VDTFAVEARPTFFSTLFGRPAPLKALTTQGVEPNPGPIYIDKQFLSGWLIKVGSTQHRKYKNRLVLLESLRPHLRTIPLVGDFLIPKNQFITIMQYLTQDGASGDLDAKLVYAFTHTIMELMYDPELEPTDDGKVEEAPPAP